MLGRLSFALYFQIFNPSTGHFFSVAIALLIAHLGETGRAPFLWHDRSDARQSTTLGSLKLRLPVKPYFGRKIPINRSDFMEDADSVGRKCFANEFWPGMIGMRSVLRLPQMSQGSPDAIKDSARLEDARALALLNTGSEARFDEVTQLVADIFSMPTALVTIVGNARTWVKSAHGSDLREMPTEVSFCGIATASNFLEVEDAKVDPRFADNPLVLGPPYIRFYAGATIYSAYQEPIGSLCLIDYKPRQLSSTERRHLRGFARIVETEMHRHDQFRRLALDLQSRALHDPVTGLPGASLLETHLARTIREAKPAEIVWVVHLHLVNHETLQLILGVRDANEVLRSLADRLRKSLRPTDQIGWLGINRFALAIRGVDDPASTHDDLLRLIEELCVPAEINHSAHALHITAGVSHYPKDISTAEGLLDYARVAAGEALRARTGLEHYSPDLHAGASRRHNQAHRLTEALEFRRLRQVYQPIICSQTGALSGVEALARWYDEIYGEVSPAEFIPLAETDPHARRLLTQWSIDRACQQIAAWDGRGTHVPFVAVNVAARELFQPDFVAMVRDCLSRNATPADRIVLEVTEQSLIVDIDTAIAAMSQLGGDKIRFAIDDFGTGYSSLKYLQRLPVDFLKIDRSFTAALDSDTVTYSLIEGVMKIAESMRLTVVIEGVETANEHRLARQLGSDMLQGFLFGRPADAADIEAFGRARPAGAIRSG